MTTQQLKDLGYFDFFQNIYSALKSYPLEAAYKELSDDYWESLVNNFDEIIASAEKKGFGESARQISLAVLHEIERLEVNKKPCTPPSTRPTSETI